MAEEKLEPGRPTLSVYHHGSLIQYYLHDVPNYYVLDGTEYPTLAHAIRAARQKTEPGLPDLDAPTIEPQEGVTDGDTATRAPGPTGD